MVGVESQSASPVTLHIMLSAATLSLLLGVLNQVQLVVGDDEFEIKAQALVQAKRELLEALEDVNLSALPSSDESSHAIAR